jgi:hypothetical protein
MTGTLVQRTPAPPPAALAALPTNVGEVDQDLRIADDDVLFAEEAGAPRHPDDAAG